MTGMIKARGEHVYLRALDVSDAEICLKWLSDPEVTRWLLAGRVSNNVESEREWIRRATAGDAFHFVITLNEGDRPIGNCALHDIDRVDSCASFGIFVGEADCRGKGYGTEAVRLAVEYAFFTQNLNRVQLETFANNERAIRCYKKVGFVEEGRLRQRRFQDGEYIDEIAMAILRDGFRRA